MTAQGVLLVTVVVWVVGLIRPIRWRTFVAALPLPMTAALLTTGVAVDGTQLVGVVGLNLFFGVVAFAYHRFGWPILLADLAGVASYLALAAALRPFALPFGQTLAVTVALWLLAMLVLRRDPAVATAVPARHAAAGDGARMPVVARLLLILAGAVLTGLLGQLLRGLVVTFPYAGVLVAVEVRRELPAFWWHFARNSLALLGFLVGVRLGQDVSAAVALTAGWAGFGLVAAVLHLPGYRSEKRDHHRVSGR
ncbi:hypothetical protein [Micromonospora lutea]|uniref:Uncharacterized protein n=1 Tax=Micromonospora lutea TaxID=419825 RepID=A0ABQ4J178_9ACTN|nr:hypothetical protein [Micromonospora lutea]GIJ23795.1 hypothetical protein Vlu01_44190 [Micromonospora lutea]